MADALQDIRNRVDARKATETPSAVEPQAPVPEAPVTDPAPELNQVASAAPEPLANQDDLGAPYMEYRTALEGETALMALRNRVRARAQPKLMEAVKPEESKVKASASAPATLDKQSLLFPAGEAVKDVVAGVPEAPTAAVRGVAGGISEMAQTAESIGNWMNANVVDFEVTQDKSGKWLYGQEARDYAKSTGEKIAHPLQTISDIVGDVRDALPQSKTTTGALVEGAAQFLVSRGVAGKLTKFAGMPATKWTSFVNDAIAGGIGFDPKEDRLSNVVDKELGSNVVTDFLKADPNDSEALGRLKSGLENGGLGAAADGVLKALGVVRAKFREGSGANTTELVAAKAADPLAEAREKYGTLKPDAFSVLGDPSKPLLEMKPKPAVRLPENMAGKLSPGEVKDTAANAKPASEIYINFARINTPDDVKAVIGQMADNFKGNIDEARRGVQNNEATKDLADSLGMSVQDVLSRRKGQGFNAEEALAARRLWAASGETLMAAAQKAAAANAGPVDQVAFRKAMSIHYAIQAEVIGARTETARALQAWSIPAGSGEAQARQIQLLLDQSGGMVPSKKLAEMVMELGEAGVSSAALNGFVRKGFWASLGRGVDVLKELRVNALLSGHKTHIMNATSNLVTIPQHIYERGVAAKIARLSGDNSGVVPGEATAMGHAVISGLKDAFRLAYQSLKSGETGASIGKTELPMTGAISSEAMRIGSETGLGRAVDFIGNVVRVPGRMLGASDEFFKTIGYRMELHAQSLRQATQEGLSGQALADRMWDIIQNPPDHIKINASDAALYATFTNQLSGFGKAITSFRDSDRTRATAFILPFLKTPLNIFNYSLERSPLAPLVEQWRADIAAGGSRRQLATTRMATGSALMLLSSDLAESGVITGAGPKDPGKREALLRQGWQPYSLKIGDRYYSYNRTDTFSATLGAAADYVEFMSENELDEEDQDEANSVAAGVIAVMANMSVSRTFMKGYAETLAMAADPERYAEKYVQNFIASFSPSALLGVKNAMDPVQRETNGTLEAIMAKLPILSERLTPKRDLWGNEVRNESGLGVGYDTLAPVMSRGQKESVADAEIVKLGIGVARIAKKTSFDGVPVDLKKWPEVYDEYVRLSGNELKHPAFGLGAKDFLDAVISGEHPISNAYRVMSGGEDGRKAQFIKSTIADFREMAQKQILQDPRFADFASIINEQKSESQRKRMPVLQ